MPILMQAMTDNLSMFRFLFLEFVEANMAGRHFRRRGYFSDSDIHFIELFISNGGVDLILILANTWPLEAMDDVEHKWLCVATNVLRDLYSYVRMADGHFDVYGDRLETAWARLRRIMFPTATFIVRTVIH